MPTPGSQRLFMPSQQRLSGAGTPLPQSGQMEELGLESGEPESQLCRLASRVTLDRFLSHAQLQLPRLQSGSDSPRFLAVWGLHELTPLRPRAWCCPTVMLRQWRCLLLPFRLLTPRRPQLLSRPSGMCLDGSRQDLCRLCLQTPVIGVC